MLLDRVGNRIVWQAVFGLLNSGCFVLLFFLPRSVNPVPLLVALGSTFALIETNAYTLLLNMVHDHRLMGTAAGLLGTSLNLALVVMPLLVSASFDYFGSYNQQNGIFAAFMGTSVLLSLWSVAMDGPVVAFGIC